MDHISENQRSPSLAHNHPPIPAVSPSAMASAAERQRRRCGSERGLVGVDCTHDSSHAKDSLLSLARAISEAVGSAILTHVSLSELGRRGTSRCHTREKMLHRAPGGLLRSEYRGAAYDLRWWLMEVAQLSRPRQDCSAFLLTFFAESRPGFDRQVLPTYLVQGSRSPSES